MTDLFTSLREHRVRAGLSQSALAEHAGVSRQAIAAIEGGAQVPQTTLALRLAEVLGCRVEDLFRLPAPAPEARLAPGFPVGGGRARLGRVAGEWVAHALAPGSMGSADAVVGAVARAAEGERARPSAGRLDFLAPMERAASTVLVAGCAPLIATLAGRTEARFSDARVAWLHAGSTAALELLAGDWVHVAGMHFAGDEGSTANEAAVRARFPGEPMLMVHLTRWTQGLIVPAGNPAGVQGVEDLARDGLRFAGREAGAGASALVRRLLGAESAGGLAGPIAGGHEEVARLVASGAADAGVAIESVALAAGLTFLPLSHESFDLVLRPETAELPHVARVLDALDDEGFRTEVRYMPGYDVADAGHVKALDAA